MTEDQSEVIRFLEAPSTHHGASVERIDTHASVVFLAGPRAWKLKRAVRYEFLDFSTVARRHAMCEAEFRINRRMSPTLYRAVVPITREAGARLRLGGSGEAIDWVIEMVRFDQDNLFDKLAEHGALPTAWMPELAWTIAAAHAGAERHPERGGVAGIRWVIDGNEAGFAEPFADILDSAACAALTLAARREVDRHHAMLEARRFEGFVRRCHGDLHLRNIVLLEGRPALFDAIEFNDAIACIDVLYDVAFLVMDLWHRRLRHHANLLLNTYLFGTGHEGLPLLPLFLSCRAAVRAKTESIEARMQRDGGLRLALEQSARAYLELAGDLLRPCGPSLLAVAGFSGSGKSTLARAVAPLVGAVPGAVVLRSDEIRKRLSGVGPLERLGPEGYTEEVSRRVYAELIDTALTVIRGGHAAIADAVFARPSDRQAIEHAAREANVPFVGFWLDVSAAALLARAADRTGDPSDAGADVIRAQLASGSGLVQWEQLDGSGSPAEVLQQAVSLLKERLPDPIRVDGPAPAHGAS